MLLDTHVHTIYSIDGYATPRDIARLADRKEIIIAVTDHDAIKGSLRANSISKRVITGTEVSSGGGHIVALGVREGVKPHMSAAETVERIHDLGGVAIAAHPFRAREGLGRKVDERFDGVEVLNARSSRRANARAWEHFSPMPIAKIGSSDAHLLEHVCSCCTSFDGESVEDALEAIRKRRTEPVGRELDMGVIKELKVINFFIFVEKMLGVRDGHNL